MRRAAALTLALTLAGPNLVGLSGSNLVGFSGFNLVGLSGCGPSEEQLERARVLRAIDILREAPSEPASAREALLTDLEKMQVKGEAAARARDACARAYRLLMEGKALQVRVEQQLKVPSGATVDTLRDLAQAESKIDESKARMQDCTSDAAALRREAR